MHGLDQRLSELATFHLNDLIFEKKNRGLLGNYRSTIARNQVIHQITLASRPPRWVSVRRVLTAMESTINRKTVDGTSGAPYIRREAVFQLAQ